MIRLLLVFSCLCFCTACSSSRKGEDQSAPSIILGEYIKGRLAIYKYPNRAFNREPRFVEGTYSIEDIEEAMHKVRNYVWDPVKKEMPPIYSFLTPSLSQMTEIKAEYKKGDQFVFFGGRYIGGGWAIIRDKNIVKSWLVSDGQEVL